MSLLFEQVYNPDILNCLANLSNDEVFTPPEVANKMLDMLPQELFRSPETTFLDPACKTGVFLREIAKRLLEGLKDVIPDEETRRRHIFTKQLFGIAITEMTSLLSRRTLYCSKYANTVYSIVPFEGIEGNIRFKNMEHYWEGNRCGFCGASKAKFDRDKSLEQHAYEFIHTNKPEEIFEMTFDVIIGNPPYHISDGGGGAGKSAGPLYHQFVQQAKKLSPRFISMIIPSRWFAGGKGLNAFREEMLSDTCLSRIVDYVDSKDCFPGGVDIPGGICYFLWDRQYNGACHVTNIHKGGTEQTAQHRVLNEYPIFVRSNHAISIIHKVVEKSQEFLDSQVSSRKPFGLESNTKLLKRGDYVLQNLDGLGYINKSDILSGHDLIDKWKVTVSKVSFEHAGVPNKDGTMRVLSKVTKLPPKSVCTETYLVAGVFDTEKEAENFMSYLKTKTVRFLIAQALASMNMSKASYMFVPILDFNAVWTDKKLFEKFNFSDKEIAHIEAVIIDMD